MSAIPHPSYELHTLGWKAFQDLCVAVAAECLGRPVQMFLPSKDGGRDGAFVGTWRSGSETGSSTIQCKFTSLPHEHLSFPMLQDEIEKVRNLVSQGLARDYIILTNHPVSGIAEAEIKAQFEKAGVERCSVFGKDWIVAEIVKSSRLRMLVPRLYGLGDLSQILDARAYEQAGMILSAMGDDLKKLVVTDAHKRSVEAISKHNLVLLLGAPAAGKSTIGASLAVGAADIWKSLTLRATSPEYMEQHLNPHEQQFIWVDDAWGSTQYQRDRTESWNRVLPLIQAAIKRGTRFLLTSRDYIWEAAKRDLKVHSLPLLTHSQVVINVQGYQEAEKAQILYNHIRMGDQPAAFRASIKEHLPSMASRADFLPETARRLGSQFLAGNLRTDKASIEKFFASPEGFLVDTISGLATDCLAALAVIYLSGGVTASPVPDEGVLQEVTTVYGVSAVQVREAMNSLNGSLVLLAHNEQGRYWTYKHPTVGDAFSTYVSRNPEFVEFFLRGAKPETLMREVVCGTVALQGASVRIMPSHYPQLLERLKAVSVFPLRNFVSYRADATFAGLLLQQRQDLLGGFQSFATPIAQDSDTSLLVRLYDYGILPPDLRQGFVEAVKTAAVEEADTSFLDDDGVASVLTDPEKEEILDEVKRLLLPNIKDQIAESAPNGTAIIRLMITSMNCAMRFQRLRRSPTA
uniref:nSTAND3 domain-containing NTPase n=1 Tax=Neorhizobium sp. EC2-8 TaxID=3129230 RepID=UPI003100B394